MNEKEFIQNLKKLKSIKPKESWLKSSRAFVLFSIEEEMRREREREEAENFIPAESISRLRLFRGVLSFILPQKRTALLLRPAGVFFSISALLLTSSIITVSAAQDTVPGDILYSVKIASEEVQKAFTTNEDDKARFEVALAGKRLEELEKILAAGTSDEEKNKQIVIVVTKFEQNVSSAKAKLDTLAQGSSAQKAVAVAQVLDSKSKEYTNTLNKVAGSVPTGVKSVIEDAAESAEKKGDSALTYIVEKHETGEVVSPEGNITKEIVDRINFTNTLISSISGDINTLLNSQTAGVALDATSTSQLASASDQLKIAASALKESELYLGRGNFITSFEKAKEGKILATTAGKRVESIKNELAEASLPPENIDTNTAPSGTPTQNTSTAETTGTLDKGP